MRRLSATDMLWNGRGSWKLRASPRWVRSMRRQAVESRPSKRTVPVSLCSVPQMQLTSVLLPEPFGPIRPSRSPGCDVEIDAVERDEAAEALADIARRGAAARSSRRSCALQAFLHQADEAVRRDDDEADQQQADDQQVHGRRDRHGGDLLQRAEQDRADQRADPDVVPPIIGMAIELTA